MTCFTSGSSQILLKKHDMNLGEAQAVDGYVYIVQDTQVYDYI